jgi:hypothetical protein
VKRYVTLAVLGIAPAAFVLAGCAGRRADVRYGAGDPVTAIEAYEGYLAGRYDLAPGDARRLLRLGVAYADAAAPRYDAERALRCWRRLVDAFPGTPEARQASLLLDALETRLRVAELEAELARRDEQLARVHSVLDSVAQAETRLRGEVESKDEARADLESRVAALTRQARSLSDELEQLQGELDALKRIDLAGVAQDAADPP